MLDGTFTIHEVRSGFDAKTPLPGVVDLTVGTAAGEAPVRGELAVKGTTWG